MFPLRLEAFFFSSEMLTLVFWRCESVEYGIFFLVFATRSEPNISSRLKKFYLFIFLVNEGTEVAPASSFVKPARVVVEKCAPPPLPPPCLVFCVPEKCPALYPRRRAVAAGVGHGGGGGGGHKGCGS